MGEFGASRERVGAGLWLAIAACSIALSTFCATQPSGSAGRAPLYDAERYALASESLSSGNLEAALRGYCDMFAGQSKGSLWTLSAVLLCDAADVAPAMAAIEGKTPLTSAPHSRHVLYLAAHSRWQ